MESSSEVYQEAGPGPFVEFAAARSGGLPGIAKLSENVGGAFAVWPEDADDRIRLSTQFRNLHDCFTRLDPDSTTGDTAQLATCHRTVFDAAGEECGGTTRTAAAN